MGVFGVETVSPAIHTCQCAKGQMKGDRMPLGPPGPSGQVPLVASQVRDQRPGELGVELDRSTKRQGLLEARAQFSFAPACPSESAAASMLDSPRVRAVASMPKERMVTEPAHNRFELGGTSELESLAVRRGLLSRFEMAACSQCAST